MCTATVTDVVQPQLATVPMFTRVCLACFLLLLVAAGFMEWVRMLKGEGGRERERASRRVSSS